MLNAISSLLNCTILHVGAKNGKRKVAIKASLLLLEVSPSVEMNQEVKPIETKTLLNVPDNPKVV